MNWLLVRFSVMCMWILHWEIFQQPEANLQLASRSYGEDSLPLRPGHRPYGGAITVKDFRRLLGKEEQMELERYVVRRGRCWTSLRAHRPARRTWIDLSLPAAKNWISFRRGQSACAFGVQQDVHPFRKARSVV